MNFNDFAFAVIAVSAAFGAWSLWGIYVVIQKGFGEHIKAMQAFYENAKPKE